jgi:hypothetical protein
VKSDVFTVTVVLDTRVSWAGRNSGRTNGKSEEEEEEEEENAHPDDGGSNIIWNGQ